MAYFREYGQNNVSKTKNDENKLFFLNRIFLEVFEINIWIQVKKNLNIFNFVLILWRITNFNFSK